MADERVPVRHDYHDLVRTDVTPCIPRSGGTLIDLGGGVGATASYLKRNHYADRVGVVDLVEPPVDGPEVDFSYCGNLADDGFIEQVIGEQGPFTTVLMLDVLEHLVDPWGLVAHLHGSLVPGGTVVATIPNVRHYTVMIPLLLQGRWTLSDSGILDRTHLRFFVRSSAIELMTSSGLVVESVTPVVGGGRSVKMLRRLTFGLLDDFIDFQFIIRVRRVD